MIHTRAALDRRSATVWGNLVGDTGLFSCGNKGLPSQSYRTIKCSSQRNEGWIYGTKEVRETQTGSGILSGHHPKVTVELKKKNLLMEKTRKERKDRNIVRTDVLSTGAVNNNL